MNQWKSPALLPAALLCTLAISLGLVGARAQGQAREQPEGAVRAAVIVAIMKFTHWQHTPDHNINICVVGATDTLGFLQPLQSRPLLGKVINVLSGEKIAVADQGCQVLVLGRGKLPPLEQLNAGQSALVVCDDCQAGLATASVELNKRGNDRVGFSINLTAAEQQQVKFNSSMLELATRVEGMDE